LLSVLSYTLIFIVIVVVFGIFGLPIGGLIAGAVLLGWASGSGGRGLVRITGQAFSLLPKNGQMSMTILSLPAWTASSRKSVSEQRKSGISMVSFITYRTAISKT